MKFEKNTDRFGTWIKKRPRRDSNSQSSDSKSDALSIRPRGHTFKHSLSYQIAKLIK